MKNNEAIIRYKVDDTEYLCKLREVGLHQIENKLREISFADYRRKEVTGFVTVTIGGMLVKIKEKSDAPSN